MRKIALFVAPLVLAACAQEPAEDTTAVEEPVAAEPEAPAMVSANGSGPGTYEVTAADGTVTTAVLNADGTYTDMDADGAVTAEGSWAVVDGKTCFTPTTEGMEAMCFTESAIAADGSFTATADDGTVVTVRPSATAAADAAPAEATEEAPADE